MAEIPRFVRAPTEINALLDEVNRIGQALRAIESYTEVSIHPLQRCESLIKDLNHIITTSIIRQCNGTPRIRRRNWLKNKRQVVQLYEKLEKERKILWEAHCAELLSVPYIYSLPDEILTRHSRSSTRRVELTTDTIKNQSIRHDSKVLSIDKRLGSMEAALSSRQSTKPYNADSSLPSSIFGRHDGFDVQSLSETAMSGHPDDWRDNIVSKEEEPTRNPLFDAFHFADVCPELYTVRTGVPNLVQAYGGDTSVSQYMRVYQFCILLLPTTSQMDSIHLTPHYKRRVQILESTTVNGHRSDQPPLSRATTQLNATATATVKTGPPGQDFHDPRNVYSTGARSSIATGAMIKQLTISTIVASVTYQTAIFAMVASWRESIVSMLLTLWKNTQIFHHERRFHANVKENGKRVLAIR
ncbi:hypothetical protein B0A52_00357 [Exophiala mesophila]|uniref:Uncharacterized protein n=1 Tax=Exophiala mesophila TaxID=212818 RepID=A0A438NJT3_EXOME|nr:hypothetical protein B0A52_00357 [Exophiala mesophila]